jgi:hypothetical protein
MIQLDALERILLQHFPLHRQIQDAAHELDMVIR